MDARLQSNPHLQFAVNGGAARNPRVSKDEALQFLSQEEQECIQFFEDTIDSLEDSIHEDDRNPRHAMSTRTTTSTTASSTSSPHPEVTVSSVLARPLSPKDQDIIDLVSPRPDLVQTRELGFNPSSPDFQSLAVTPESHVEVKSHKDTLPSEYQPPGGSYGASDSHHPYHPPGCIPTPVLIAQQIAETQAGGTSNTSSLHRTGVEPLNHSTDPTVKHGPPTSAKPTRFPPNISIILGNKEHQNQSLANVSIEERRAQMLANLTGTSHPLLLDEPQPAVDEKTRNTPTRSVSFRDPTPDKSRLEALSKLGLNRNRAMSGGTTLLSGTTFPDPPTDPGISSNPREVTVSPTTENTTKVPEARVSTPPQIQRSYERKPETQLSPTGYRRSWEERNPQPSPSPPAVTHRSFTPPILEYKEPVLPPPEVTSLEFNNYGGKSIIINPSVSSRSEPSPTSPEPRSLPPALANPSEFNSFGGKSKVMHTGPLVVTRSDLPDILSSHINKGQSSPVKSEPTPIELNSYGGKSRTFNPSAGLSRSSENQTRSVKPPAPAPAPRPARHSYHVTPQKPSQQVGTSDHKRRTGSAFRPQGITVQFGGRGTSDESRKEALKKLGLLKESG